MRVRGLLLSLALTAGCGNEVQYTMGDGLVYVTRCASTMTVEGEAYKARCDPPSCKEGFRSMAVNHVVVALDPGTRVVGNAERVCVQDMAEAMSRAGLKVGGTAGE